VGFGLQTGMISSALEIASARGYEKLVRMLIENGTYINAHGRLYENALHAATTNLHQKVVQLLLSKGANLHDNPGPSVPISSCSDHSFVQPLVAREDHSGEVYCVAFSPDGKWLATAGEDGSCIAYDFTNFLIVHEFHGHLHSVCHIAWSPDSKMILTTSRASQARVWHVNSGK